MGERREDQSTDKAMGEEGVKVRAATVNPTKGK